MATGLACLGLLGLFPPWRDEIIFLTKGGGEPLVKRQELGHGFFLTGPRAGPGVPPGTELPDVAIDWERLAVEAATTALAALGFAWVCRPRRTESNPPPEGHLDDPAGTCQGLS